MSDYLAWFRAPAGIAAVATPSSAEDMIKDWATVRRAMMKTVAPGFSRDEWAYLASFLDAEKLWQPWLESFGQPIVPSEKPPNRLYRPRGAIAVWLPGNVSLLGPLTLVLLSLTGQPLRMKLSTSSDDLAGAFLRFARENLPEGVLKEHLDTRVAAHSFGRGDPRERELARDSQVRIVFGSDEAAQAIDALPHPVNSVGISFADRQSEAWLDMASINDDTLTTLLRVFAIYGQAGCTSPGRVVLLDATTSERDEVFERLRRLAAGLIRGETPMHVASENLMAAQWAQALGWGAEQTPGNTMVLAAGDTALEDFESLMTIKLQVRSRDEAFAALPDNIQTIGYALGGSVDTAWLERLADSRIARFVPLAQMHHFSSTWDGESFWRQCFEVMELGS